MIPAADTSNTRGRGSFARSTTGLLWVVWFVAIPGLLSAVALRYLVPLSWQTRGSWAEAPSAWVHHQPLLVWAVLFIALSIVLGYWTTQLLAQFPLPRPAGEERGAGWNATQGGETDVEARRHFTRALWLALGVAGAIASASLLRGHVAQAYAVDGVSMLPTVEPDDVVLGNHLAYRRALLGLPAAPRRGDVVVVANSAPERGPAHLVKRVIGLPGDEITMHGNVPVINGWPVPGCDAGYYLHASHHGGAQGRVIVEFIEDHAYLALYSPLAEPMTGAFRVPPDEVFVVGDNRAMSLDSRVWNGGVAIANIEGQVSRFLATGRLDERLDLRSWMRSVELHPHFGDLDARELEQGIATCLAHRPADTHVPASSDPPTSVAVAPGPAATP